MHLRFKRRRVSSKCVEIRQIFETSARAFGHERQFNKTKLFKCIRKVRNVAVPGLIYVSENLPVFVPLHGVENYTGNRLHAVLPLAIKLHQNLPQCRLGKRTAMLRNFLQAAVNLLLQPCLLQVHLFGIDCFQRRSGALTDKIRDFFIRLAIFDESTPIGGDNAINTVNLNLPIDQGNRVNF